MLRLFLLLSLTAPFALCQENSPQSQAPLNEPELRLLYDQLIELKAGRKQIDAMQKADDRDRLADERDRAIAAREVEQEKKEADIARQERDLANEKLELTTEQRDFYKKAYEDLTRGTSFGCRVKKILTLGFARCR
jgi:uncharacterized protein (DUF3084 family)